MVSIWWKIKYYHVCQRATGLNKVIGLENGSQSTSSFPSLVGARYVDGSLPSMRTSAAARCAAGLQPR
jgi:hypothetical protein